MRVHWLRSALADLEHIGDYIALDSPTAAERVTARIVNAVEKLANFPGLGRPGRVIGTRELVISHTPYIVAYRVRGQTVELLAVLHGAQQWPDTFE